jgi:hypothetical protein
MNRIPTALFGAAFLCATLFYAQQPPSGETTPPETQAPTPAQTAPAPTTQPPNQSATAGQTGVSSRIAPGSVIPVQLTKTVDAKKAKTGDEVVAKVTQDLKNTSGVVIMPKDTEVIGHVTEAQRRDKEQKESELVIAFDKAVIKNGETMQMPMSIQAIIATPNQNSTQNAQNSQGGSGYPGGSMPAGSPSQSGSTSQGSSHAPAGGAESMPTAPASAENNPTPSPQPQITGNTQGVIGISNLTLAAGSNPQQGSVVTSEKNNVKLEGGTFMLLRVH